MSDSLWPPHNLELITFHTHTQKESLSWNMYLGKMKSIKLWKDCFTLEISSLDMGHHTTQDFMLTWWTVFIFQLKVKSQKEILLLVLSIYLTLKFNHYCLWFKFLIHLFFGWVIFLLFLTYTCMRQYFKTLSLKNY